MRSPDTVWKVVCAISAFVLVFQPLALGQMTEHDKRLDPLFSSDPALRGKAKDDLLQYPDPTLLPALLKALPSSKGSNRDDLFEVLAKYDDPRKIPAFLALLKETPSDSGTSAIQEQLSRLGVPAAEALLANCAGQDEVYGQWAAGVLSWMHEIGARYLIEAVQSDDACKHSAGEQGLLYMSDADDVAREDTRLAAEAAIDPDQTIRGAARQWFATWKGKEGEIEFSGIVEALIAAYQSSAPPETMVKIARMLSQPERPRVTRFMRAAQNSPNPEIQVIAMDYLSIHPPKAPERPARTNSKSTSPQQKIALLDKLKDSPKGDVNKKIVPFLSDSDETVRAAAAAALGSVNGRSNDVRQEREIHPETASPALRNALKDPSPKVRAAAAEAFGEIRSSDDVPSMIFLLKDSDPSVLLAAAAALQEIPESADSAAPALTDIYRNEQNSRELRWQAVATLGAICSPDSIPIFLEVLAASDNPSQEAAAALECTLKKRPDKSAFEPILRAFQKQKPVPQNWFLEASLIHALGATKNPQAFDTLAGLLKSSDFEMTRRGAEALGVLGDKRAIPLLAGLLKNPDNNVRSAAAFALTQFSDFSAPPELIVALQSQDTVLQIHVPTALVKSHDPKAIDALIAAMPTQPSAIYALGESHDSRAVPAMIVLLQNAKNKTENRANAATSLGKLGDARAVEPLIASLNEDNMSITMSASAALGQLKDKRAIEPLKQAYARWSTGQRQSADSVKGSIVDALRQLGVRDLVKIATGMPTP
jgi:HEAT repeat protein